MTTEQKAKAYDEALKVANNELRACGTFDCDCARQIFRLFPELKENKEPDDEKVRKGLIELVKQSSEILEKKNQEQMIDWLEKQGEHDSIEEPNFFDDFRKTDSEVEPKFHEGDIIKPKDGGHEPWQIMQVDIFDKKYRFKDGYVIHFSQEDAYELVEQKPADKEMKELLQTEYEKGRADAIAEMQKSWSEDDEKFVHGLIRGLSAKRDIYGHTTFSSDGIDITKTIDWLKSLKDRIQPQPKQEWSKEDKEHIKSLLERLEGMCKKDATFIRTKFAVSEDEYWLKSIRPQNRWKPSDEQMKVLWNVYQGGEEQAELATLYNDLKKLREEDV